MHAQLLQAAPIAAVTRPICGHPHHPYRAVDSCRPIVRNAQYQNGQVSLDWHWANEHAASIPMQGLHLPVHWSQH